MILLLSFSLALLALAQEFFARKLGRKYIITSLFLFPVLGGFCFFYDFLNINGKDYTHFLVVLLSVSFVSNFMAWLKDN